MVMEEFVGEINVPLLVTDQFVEDVMVTALEGGSNYWIASVKPLPRVPGTPTSVTIARAIIGGESITFKAHEGDKGTLTLKRFLDGVQKYVDHKISHVRGPAPKFTGPGYLERHRESYLRDPFGFLDPGNIDAGDADVILQFAVFGEIVFG